MTRRLTALLVVLAGVAAVAAFAWFTRPREKIPWRTDFAAAGKEAQTAGKPMLLDFTASWCGPCQDMRRTTWSDPKVARALASYVPVQIDVDSHPDLAREFNAQAIPHLAVLDPQGNLLKWTEGELPPDGFLAWLASPPGTLDALPPIRTLGNSP